MLRAIRCKPLYCSLMMVGAWLVSAHALALPLSYSESVSGDITSPAAAFVLDAGANMIAGTTHFSVNSPGGPRFDTDFDSFAFTVPSGLQLSGITLAFATSALNVSGASLELRLCRAITTCSLDPIELLGSAAADLLRGAPLAIDFGSSLPLLAGTYSLIVSGIGIGIADVSIPQAGWFADYAWTLAVQDVREPNAVWLLGLGLAGLAVIRRRFAGSCRESAHG
jgi:hypothetical protein